MRSPLSLRRAPEAQFGFGTVTWVSMVSEGGSWSVSMVAGKNSVILSLVPFVGVAFPDSTGFPCVMRASVRGS